MDLNVIVENKNDYYKLASEYLKKIKTIELDVDFDEIIRKSISILVDHDFIPTPCIEIKLELRKYQIKQAIILFMLMKTKNLQMNF